MENKSPQNQEVYWEGFFDCVYLFKRICLALTIDNFEVVKAIKEIVEKSEEECHANKTS